MYLKSYILPTRHTVITALRSTVDIPSAPAGSGVSVVGQTNARSSDY